MFQALHIKGIKNIAADQLSRLQIHQFKKDFPLMDPVPAIVNPDLLII